MFKKLKGEHITIFMILFLSLLLRLLILDRGLPSYPHVDEKDFIVRALLMVRRLNFDPGWYGHPGTIFMYMLYPFYLLNYVLNIGLLNNAGVINYNTLKELFHNGWATYVPEKVDAYLIARGVNSVLSVGVIFLVYLFAKKLFQNGKVASLSAILISLSPLFLVYGTYARSDIASMFFILLSMFIFYGVVETGNKKTLALASFIVGMGMAARYHAFAASLPIGIYAIFTDYITYRNKGTKAYITECFKFNTNLVISVVLGILGFYLSTPFVFLNFKNAFLHIRFEARGTHRYHERLPGILNYLWYVKNVLIIQAGGLMVFLAFVYGVFNFIKVRILKKFDIKALYFLIFPVIFFIFISEGRLRWERWMIPFLAYEMLFAGYGILRLSKQIKFSGFAFVLLSVIVTVFPFYSAFRSVVTVRKNRMSNVVKEWISKNVDEESKLALEYYNLRDYKELQSIKNIELVNIKEGRIFQKFDSYKGYDYLLTIKDASLSLKCFPVPFWGYVEKGDYVCDENFYGNKADEKRLEGFTLIKTVDIPSYSGIKMNIYKNERK